LNEEEVEGTEPIYEIRAMKYRPAEVKKEERDDAPFSPYTISIEEPPTFYVSLFELDEYVTQMDIEVFENRKYELERTRLVAMEEEQAKEREVRAKLREARRLSDGAPVARQPWSNIRVVIPTRRRTLEDIDEEVVIISPTPSFHTADSIADDIDDQHAYPASEYEIETILSHKNIMGTIHFQVKWKGLPKSKATWLDEHELEGVEDLVEEYMHEFNWQAGKLEPDSTGRETEEHSGTESSSTAARHGRYTSTRSREPTSAVPNGVQSESG